MKIKKGFTLIELLIVVLIIAILAAIAVPNFLEFQTRAKVSRIHSDMRTIAIGLEAYYVDNDDYIIGIANGEALGIWTRDAVTNDMNILYARLTTPISYLSSVPEDPFIADRGAVASNGTARLSDAYWFDDTNFPGNTRYRPAYESGFEWFLRSWGPTATGGPPFPAEILGARSVDNIYDPTNGTTSLGFILRTSKGIYPEAR